MRIMQVLLSRRVGGAESLAQMLSLEWIDAGIETSTIYLDPDRSRSNVATRLRHVRFEISNYAPDCVFSHSALPNVYARMAAPSWVPVVPVLHSATDDFAETRMRVAERLLMHRTPLVVCVSEMQAAVYRNRFIRMSGRVAVIPNGIRSDIHQRSESDRPRRVGVLARVVAQKRPDIWVNAAIVVGHDYPDVDFVWWGPLLGEDFRILDRISPHPNVLFPGEAEDPSAALASIDIFLHTADREAFSIALLEAAAAGIPIVCSRDVIRTLPATVPAIPFKTGDTQDAARALRDALENFPSHAAAARAAAGSVRDKYSAARCAATYRAVVEAVARPDDG